MYMHVLLRRSAEKAEKAAADISQATGSTTVEAFHADLSSLKQTRQLAEDVKKAHPSIDVLVNNAGPSHLLSNVSWLFAITLKLQSHDTSSAPSLPAYKILTADFIFRHYC